MERELVVVTWDGVSSKPSKIEKLHEVDQGTTNVFNDGKADPSGRLWIGKSYTLIKLLLLQPREKYHVCV